MNRVFGSIRRYRRETKDILRLRYVKITGIENLKIQQNNVIGLFIEVPQRQAHKLDTSLFVHKQTTTTAVRFSTPELFELEKILDVMNSEIH